MGNHAGNRNSGEPVLACPYYPSCKPFSFPSSVEDRRGMKGVEIAHTTTTAAIPFLLYVGSL